MSKILPKDVGREWPEPPPNNAAAAGDQDPVELKSPEALEAWRRQETGRTWPDHCSLSTETLGDEEYDHAVDLVMTDRGRHLDAMHPDDRNGLLSRALATIRELRTEVATDDLLLEDREHPPSP